MKLDFTGDTIDGPLGAIITPWPVKEARLVGNKIIALAEHDTPKPPSMGLAAYSPEGRLLWEARREENYDVFVAVNEGPTFTATTWGGLHCAIDLETGRTITQEFVK